MMCSFLFDVRLNENHREYKHILDNLCERMWCIDVLFYIRFPSEILYIWLVKYPISLTFLNSVIAN